MFITIDVTVFNFIFFSKNMATNTYTEFYMQKYRDSRIDLNCSISCYSQTASTCNAALQIDKLRFGRWSEMESKSVTTQYQLSLKAEIRLKKTMVSSSTVWIWRVHVHIWIYIHTNIYKTIFMTAFFNIRTILCRSLKTPMFLCYL